MAVKRSVSRLNKRENVVITRWGNGNVSCSLQDSDDTEVELSKSAALSGGKPQKRSSLPKSSPPPSSSSQQDNPFKAGDKVIYEDKIAEVTRAYTYKDKPYCILDGKRQVSATKLKPKK